ncbi:MAG: hypothetical protein EBX41_11255 [Chitinophagia bacterium]|nr:hypothetical protein [Chitinophagia bacterium]
MNAVRIKGSDYATDYLVISLSAAGNIRLELYNYYGSIRYPKAYWDTREKAYAVIDDMFNAVGLKKEDNIKVWEETLNTMRSALKGNQSEIRKVFSKGTFKTNKTHPNLLQ